MLAQLLSEHHGQLAAWDYLKKHWTHLHTTLGDMWIGNLVEVTGSLPISQREDMKAFFDANLNGVAELSYARAMETQQQLAEFQERTKDDLIAWFKK